MAVLSLGRGNIVVVVAAGSVFGGVFLGLLVAGTNDTKTAGGFLLGLGIGYTELAHLGGKLAGLSGGGGSGGG